MCGALFGSRVSPSPLPSVHRNQFAARPLHLLALIARAATKRVCRCLGQYVAVEDCGDSSRPVPCTTSALPRQLASAAVVFRVARVCCEFPRNGARECQDHYKQTGSVNRKQKRNVETDTSTAHTRAEGRTGERVRLPGVHVHVLYPSEPSRKDEHTHRKP